MDDFEKTLMAHDGLTSLFFIAQAGFILKSKLGTTIGVDLYLTDCVERYDGFKRLSPKVMRPDAKLDYIISSHWHLDHFDVDAIPLLMSNGNTKLVCSEDCQDHVNRLHLDENRITYIKVGDTVKCNDITVNAVFCDHGINAPLAVGFVFVIDRYRIYMAGDTALRLDKASEIAKFGPFDVMIAPINGAFGNLNERENVELCKYHSPQLVIPCHFWTFAEQHGDPGLWIDIIKEEIPDQNYVIMAPGERIIMDKIIQ